MIVHNVQWFKKILLRQKTDFIPRGSCKEKNKVRWKVTEEFPKAKPTQVRGKAKRNKTVNKTRKEVLKKKTTQRST